MTHTVIASITGHPLAYCVSPELVECVMVLPVVTLKGLGWDEARLVQGQWLAPAREADRGRELIERHLGEALPEGQASLP